LNAQRVAVGIDPDYDSSGHKIPVKERLSESVLDAAVAKAAQDQQAAFEDEQRRLGELEWQRLNAAAMVA
jgi:hypothetical protein